MRQLTVLAPATLLAVLALIPVVSERGHPARLPARELEPEIPPRAGIPANGAGGVVWLSHDWIEVPTADGAVDPTWRRTAFGLDRIRADCTDPTCRACLIDLVYGQEY